MLSIFFINMDESGDARLEEVRILPLDAINVNVSKQTPLLDLRDDSVSLCRSYGCRTFEIYPPVQPYHRPYHPQEFRLQRTYL